MITKDGVLIARHENEISATTNVAAHPEFAARKTTKTIDGTPMTGWFAEDFTLKEIKTLRAKERIPAVRPANTAYDGQESIPTLDEVLRLVRRSGRPVGIYPETKHPSYFRQLGLPLEEPLLRVLAKHGYRQASDPVFIQSFEVDNLRALRARTKLRLIQLLDSSGSPYGTDPTSRQHGLNYAEMAKPASLAAIRKYADGVGVSKQLLITQMADGSLGAPTTLVADAHAAGLLVHVWTFRDEDAFLPKGLKGNPAAELAEFLSLGIDGVFADNPATALAARAKRR